MRVPRAFLALLCGGAICWAQNAPSSTINPAAGANQAEISQRDSPATFSSRVNLVQVPVVVRDKQGHPVGNLTKDDFLLYDKGKPQLISKFVVEKAGTPYIPAVRATDENAPADASETPTAPIPERFIAYLFDDLHLKVDDLLRMRQALWTHIAESQDAVTRVSIVTSSGIGVLDFTDDLDKIQQTLNAIHPNTRMPLSGNNCPSISLYMADLIINKNDPTALALTAADAKACDNNPNSTVDYQSLARSAAISVLSIGEGDTARVLEAIEAMEKRMSAMPGSRNIVVISPGFLVPGDDLRPAEAEILDRAIRANVVINTLDARGVYTVIPGGDASTRVVNTTSVSQRTNYTLQEQLADQDILEELATGTGGSFFENDNGFKEGLSQLTKQPEFIYLLGFTPADLKYDGSFHGLKVTLRSPTGLTLSARRGYYAPKRPTDPEEAAREDIREAVFSRDEVRDIPVDLRIQFFKSSPSNARLTVVSRVDVTPLHFKKEQDRSKNTLTVVAGLFDRNGNFVNGIQRIVDMNLRDQTLEALGKSGISLRENFDVTPGIYTIRIVVRDAEGQMMAARNGAVQIP